ncbi:MAG TPA: sulfurtransferase [Thermomicrobiales bacterium]|nr:sulfurtransferase [Thermomicrobiales bacterium]
MTTKPCRSWSKRTRRDAIAGGIGIGTAVVTGAVPRRGVATQQTPQASPASSGGYARSEPLVAAAWLKAHLTDPGMVVVAFMPVEEAEAEHIPGAEQIDWPVLEVTDTSDASLTSWQESVEGLLGVLGITQDSTVVVYDAGTLFAARLWWILHWLGHEQVHVLDGGLAAWKASGFEVQHGPITPSESTHLPYNGQPNGTVLAQLDEVLQALDDANTTIVDARTPSEYADGHIPGAVNINYPRNAYDEPPKRYRPADELLEMYAEAGVTTDRRVIPYCLTGVRSAVTFFTLHLLGFDELALFTGSWEEWSSDPNTPKATGQ